MKTHSDDPDVAQAAQQAAEVIERALSDLPTATQYDYGGHVMQISDYSACTRCTSVIAEAQAASACLDDLAEQTSDETIREHIALAAQYMRLESESAQIRAMLHSGHGSEPIINTLLGFVHQRSIQDSYDHSHNHSEQS